MTADVKSENNVVLTAAYIELDDLEVVPGSSSVGYLMQNGSSFDIPLHPPDKTVTRDYA